MEDKNKCSICFALDNNLKNEQYVIICLEQKSNEGTLLFWKDKAKGYTSDFQKAGIFSKESAINTNKKGRDIALTLKELDKLNSTKIYTVVDCDFEELKKIKEGLI